MLGPRDFFAGTNRVWRHYKQGNLYLVLWVVQSFNFPCERDVQEGEKFAMWIEYDLHRIGDTEFRGCFRCESAQYYEGQGVAYLGDADYTGAPRRLTEKDPLVVYVGLYDNPKGNRMCMRPVAEWDEMVYPTSAQFSGEARVPRYTKVS